MLQENFLLFGVQFFLFLQEISLQGVNLLEELVEPKVGLPLILKKSVEVDLQKVNLVLDVVAPFDHHIVQLDKYFVQTLNVLIVGLNMEHSPTLIKLSEFVPQLIKLVDFIYPQGLEFFTCSCHLFVQNLTFSYKILELFVVNQVVVIERNLDQSCLGLC